MQRDPELRAFVPRWARASAFFIGVLLVGGGAFVLWQTSNALKDVGGAGIDRRDVVAIAGVMAIGVWLLWRLGGVRADPTTQLLRVRNVIRTREVQWAQIIAVSFTPSNPWVLLDLADGTRLAVMGIQQADGRRGRSEAARLRRLVEAYGTATDPHAPDPHAPEQR